MNIFNESRFHFSNSLSPIKKDQSRIKNSQKYSRQSTWENLENDKSPSNQYRVIYRKNSNLMDEKRTSYVAVLDDAISPKKTSNLESLFKDLKPLSANNSFEIVLEEEEENSFDKGRLKEPEEEEFIIKKPIRGASANKKMLSSTGGQKKTPFSENIDAKESNF